MTDPQRFKFIMSKWGVNAEQMAVMVGVRERAIWNYLNGSRKISRQVWTSVKLIQALINIGYKPDAVLRYLERHKSE